VHAVAGDHEVRVGGQVVGAGVALVLQADAERTGPRGEEFEQPVTADAEALVAAVTDRQITYVGDAVAPADGGLGEGAGRFGGVGVEFVGTAA
jgi:hypothetical protein